MLEKLQTNFILDKLSTNSDCNQVRDKYINHLEKISFPVIQDILNNKFDIGADMKAVSCLLQTIFFSASTRRTKGIYNLSDKINKWIKKISKLGVESSEGVVYISDILYDDIQVIIKVQKERQNMPDSIREYFLGIRAINTLRYKIPTFCYTLGAFLCPEPVTNANGDVNICTTGVEDEFFVLYEKIPGKTIGAMLSSGEMNFDTWLCIFVQLLLSLEVAQRDHQFTHFDLHTDNVMIRNVSNDFSYDIPLDNKLYEIRNPGMIPVIIDYGLATSYIDGEYIGAFNFPHFGMLNYMVPGCDMYKFMVNSMFSAKGETREQIRDLFRFYSDTEPYKIWEYGEIAMREAMQEFCKEVTLSPAATNIPLEMVEWIWDNYQTILVPHISLKDREKYLTMKYSNYNDKYQEIFQDYSAGIDNIIKFVTHHENSSYMTREYEIMILKKYNEELQSEELKLFIEKLKSSITLKKKYSMINSDIDVLQEVFDIKLPRQSTLDKIVDKILKVPMKNESLIRNAVKYHEILSSYQEEFTTFAKFYYTIIELGLQNMEGIGGTIYRNWVRKFKNSEAFKLYNKNSTRNHRAIRWGQTLLASIQ